jgi:protoheme ferro-lyase
MATRDEVEAVADYLEERAHQWSLDVFYDDEDFNDSWNEEVRDEIQAAHQAADLLRQFAALLT